MSDARVLHFFGGKGGVGKTTLAAAYALRLAEEVPKEKVLLVSLDPVRSLSDLLNKKLSAKPVKVEEDEAAAAAAKEARPEPKGKGKAAKGKADGGVWAMEVEPAALAKGFLAKYVPALQKAAVKGQHLTEEDLGKLYGQATPGLEELLGLLHVVELAESGEFDRVVVDTAPTSHTLRLFDMPVGLRKFLGIVKAGAERAAGKGKKAAAPSEEQLFLEEFAAKAEKLLALLKDPARSAFHLVTLGEPVPEAQTRMYFTQLRERGIPVVEVVVNQVEDKEGCTACLGRRGLQAPHVRKYQALDKNVPVHLVLKREVAPRGLELLKPFAKEWASGKETKTMEFAASEGPPALVRAPSMPPIAAPPLPPTRLIFFVGQGGVGKSSCAAAAAVTLTEKEGPVLLISTDPAHSLSDVLQSRLTDVETQVKGTKGLYARELDMAGWFGNLRKRWKEKAERAFEGAPKTGNEVPTDLLLFRNLLDAAPPGIDELAAMSCLTDALVQERFKRIVVDGAPMVSSMRVVELADTAKGWFTALHGVLSKYKSKGLGELADDMASFLKHIKRFEDALASPNESRFVVVTRGEELAAARSERLVEYLKERKLQVERVLVNRVGPKADCPKCENRRKNELDAAKVIEKKIGLPVTVAPALGRHPAGLRELKAFRTAWYALSATAKTKAA